MADRLDEEEAFWGPCVSALVKAKGKVEYGRKDGNKSTTEIMREVYGEMWPHCAKEVENLSGKELVEEFLDSLIGWLESGYIFMVPRLNGRYAIKPGYFFLDHEGKFRVAERVAVGRNDYSIQDTNGKWHYFEHDEVIDFPDDDRDTVDGLMQEVRYQLLGGWDSEVYFANRKNKAKISKEKLEDKEYADKKMFEDLCRRAKDLGISEDCVI